MLHLSYRSEAVMCLDYYLNRTPLTLLAGSAHGKKQDYYFCNIASVLICTRQTSTLLREA